MMRTFIQTAAASLLAAVIGSCADEPGGPRTGGDYSECGEVANNQMVTCDSLLRGVEGLCGFNLTVDPCACAARLEGCIQDVDWLEGIISCEEDSADCTGYIDCLSEVGSSPSGCHAPSSWDCLTTSPAGE